MLRSWQQLGNASGSERDGAREESVSVTRKDRRIKKSDQKGCTPSDNGNSEP